MTTFEHLRFGTLRDMSAGIASGALSPVDCVRHSIELIDRHNTSLQAFLSHHAKTALTDARAAEDEIASRGPRSPVHGIPFGIKDLFAVQGMRRTCGSRVYKQEICTADANVVNRLRKAGAIFIGMTSLNEFAYGPTGINAVSASPRNPWDEGRSCGGSSSGSGCAVAAGLVPAALGTDTGGSVRLPAALCGISGLKPSFGLTSRHGIQPLSTTFDHPGTLAHLAWDCGLILEAMAGPDRNDPTTWHRPTFKMPSEPDGDALMGRRIGILESLFQADLTSYVAAAFEATLGDLERLGCKLSTVHPQSLNAGMESWSTIILAEAFQVHADRVRDHHDDLSPDVAARLLLGRDITIAAYCDAVRQRNTFLSDMAGVMESYDFLIAPTAVIPAVAIETGDFESDTGPISGSRMLGKLTRLANQTGQPAISVPCGFTPDGLPVGLQMIGRWFGDSDLVQAAAAFQLATDWHSRHPSAFDDT